MADEDDGRGGQGGDDALSRRMDGRTGVRTAMRELPPAEAMAEKAEQAALFLRALTNPHRLMILCLLDGCERSVTDLEQHLGLRQPTLSQQLAKLRAEGLVETRRDGKFVYYRLASPEAREVIAVLFRLFCEPETVTPPRTLVTAS